MRWDSWRRAAAAAANKRPSYGRACSAGTAVGGREDSRKRGTVGRGRPPKPADISILTRPRGGSRRQRRPVRGKAAGFVFYASLGHRREAARAFSLYP